MKFSFIISLALAVLVVLFSLQNATPVRVTFFHWSYEASLVIILLLTFVAGVVSAYIISLPGYIKMRRELSECKKAVKESAKEPPAINQPFL
jgi:uncharacterized integral membrane protein